MMFEYYLCKLDSVVVYVGEGLRGRHKHCNSGASHVYELNKLHFEGKVFDMSVYYCGTKEEAEQKELEMIELYKPVYNRKHTGRCNKIQLMGEAYTVKAKLKSFEKLLKRKYKGESDYTKLVNELFAHFGYKAFLKDEINFRSADFYTKRGLCLIASFSRSLKRCGIVGDFKNETHKVLYQALFEGFNLRVLFLGECVV